MKPSDPLLLAEGTLHCGMYPASKDPISRHLATPGFPQHDHTVGKLSADPGSLCSEVQQTSWPQVILKCQPPICLDYRARNRPQLWCSSTWLLLRNLNSILFWFCLHTEYCLYQSEIANWGEELKLILWSRLLPGKISGFQTQSFRPKKCNFSLTLLVLVYWYRQISILESPLNRVMFDF